MKTALLWIFRLLLGGVFIYAAALKIADPAGFATDIQHFRLLPYPLTLGLGLYLPWLEIICGVSVLCRWRERCALLLLAGLCFVFSVALASAWYRGLDINCGCFGHGTAASDLPLAFARSLLLGLVALFLFKQAQKPRVT